MDYEIFNKPWLKSIRRKLRKDSTRAERELWRRLRNKRIGYKFRRQHSIGPYVADFYCPDFKLVIELDGQTHDDLNVLKNDYKKEKYVNGLNLRLVRISNQDVLKDPDAIAKHIKNICDKLK